MLKERVKNYSVKDAETVNPEKAPK